VTVPLTSSDLESRPATGQNFLVNLDTLAQFDLIVTKFGMVTLHYIQVILSGLKSKTAKPLNGVSVHGVSVTMRTNERKGKFEPLSENSKSRS